MRIQILVLSLMLSLLPVAVWAHGDSSWKTANVAKTEKKKFGDAMEWVVSFKNDKISDSSKQILYVFVTLGGEVVGANHTGK